MRILFLWSIVFLAAHALAHPGSGIAVDAQGRVFFTAGPTVILIETNGTARAIVHDKANEKFYQLHHIQRAPDGGLVTASDLGNAIWRFTVEGHLTKFHPATGSDTALPVGQGGDPFAIDRAGNIYAVKSEQYRSTQILKIRPDGQSSVLAGSGWGLADGRGPAAKFADLHGGSMLATPEGGLLVTDTARVRRIAPDGTVSTLSGKTNQPAMQPYGLALDDTGNIFVADHAGFIRKIDPRGDITTVAGSGKGRSVDGPQLEAVLNGPTGLARAPNGDLFVLEPGEPRVRKISGGRVVTLHRGLP